MRRLPKLRLWFLGIVNALILLHIALYYAFDRTSVGCIDFFGLSTFAGKGLITSGSIFLAVVILSTLVLGRVFCGWGCHFAFFQDIVSGLAGKLGLHVPFRRSRLEYVVPPLLFVVTLLYPVAIWWRDRGFPKNVSTDLAYPELWHLLPGAKGVLLILLVDVVVLTLLFGKRAFCRFICPYGLFLKFFHALAPFRVVKRGSCTDCGACSRSCPAGVPIKYEINSFGLVRDLNCMNCGDCVASCPEGALAMRPTKRAYERRFVSAVQLTQQALWVDVVLVLFVVAGLIVYRGRQYGDFLSAGLGLTVGAVVVTSLRPRAFARSWHIRKLLGGRRATIALLGLYLALGMIGQVIGMGLVRSADDAFERGDYGAVSERYSSCRRSADMFRPFVFYLDDANDNMRRRVPAMKVAADSAMTTSAWEDAEALYRAVLAADRTQIGVHGNLGTALFRQGQYWESAACYLEVLRYDPNDLVALYHLAMARIQLGQADEAVQIVQKMLSIDTVGESYRLIRDNPLFELLREDQRYVRVMAMYQPGE